MSWFADVPLELKVAGTRLLLAGEAVQEQERRLNPFSDLFDSDGERPETDWAATGLFALARLQLDQLVQILDEHFEMPVSLLSGSEVTRRLRRTVGDLALKKDDDLVRAVDCIGEGVDLWRALDDVTSRPVTHAFAVDGSISFTHGPDLPELAVLGLRACTAGELEVTPLQVLEAASGATEDAGWLAVVVKKQQHRDARHAEMVQAARAKHDAERELRVLRDKARDHTSVWWESSEGAFVSWVFDLLEGAGLASAADPLAVARTSARVMSLWAIHLEFAAHSGEGTPGDWRYEIGKWLNNGISEEQLRLLNESDALGWAVDDEEYESPFPAICIQLVEQYSREVVAAMKQDLGDSFTFAYFWAARLEEVPYPVPAELIGDIVNDESVLFEDPHNKLPAFNWVQSGMSL